MRVRDFFRERSLLKEWKEIVVETWLTDVEKMFLCNLYSFLCARRDGKVRKKRKKLRM